MIIMCWKMFCSDFQTTVLQMLVRLRSDIKELKQQLDNNTAILQSMTATDDDKELDIPSGVDLPVATDSHVRALEEALTEGPFRKRLVSTC